MVAFSGIRQKRFDIVAGVSSITDLCDGTNFTNLEIRQIKMFRISLWEVQQGTDLLELRTQTIL